MKCLKLMCVLCLMFFSMTSIAARDYVFDPKSPYHFLYQPPGAGPFPAILLLHASTGIEKINHTWAMLLRDQGYLVYMIDSFKPRGWLDRQSVGWDKATAAQIADVGPAYEHLQNLSQVDRNKIGLLGFSMGGFDVLRVRESRQQNFKAAASFYGVCHRLSSETILEGPTRIFIGANDDRAPTASCQALVERSSQRGKSATIQIYPDAPHGFDNDAFPPSKEIIDERGERYHVGYNAKAADQAKKDLLAYFETTLKS